jgi:serine/threonine-protein kinase
VFTPGDQIGDYEIVAKLKSGGMATLFLGRRRGASGFAKHVAIKVVHEHLAEDPAFVRMFVDEALLSARIEHPNVVHVEELRERDGRHFLVMEYVRGVSLWQLLATLARRGRRVNPVVAAYIAVKVADGLHAAHETRGPRGELMGVVHRDVSPQNVLLSYQGNIKLIDFGVAKARGRIQNETSGGSIKGKFRYMSPEQAWGREVDRRSDVYSLGTVLWELLTMRRRFENQGDALILDLVRDPEPIPPSVYAEGISAELDAVVMKAHAKRPEDRYQSAQQLRTALLETVPGAALFHESQLGSLLVHVMADHIEKEAMQLPQSVTGLTHAHDPDHAPADDVLHTMTLSSVGAELVEDETDPTGKDEIGSGIERESPPATPTPTPSGTPATPSVLSIAPPPRSNALLVTAISTGMLAALLFGIVVVLGLHLSGDRSETVVRPTSVGASAPETEPVRLPDAHAAGDGSGLEDGAGLDDGAEVENGAGLEEGPGLGAGDGLGEGDGDADGDGHEVSQRPAESAVEMRPGRSRVDERATPPPRMRPDVPITEDF